MAHHFLALYMVIRAQASMQIIPKTSKVALEGHLTSKAITGAEIPIASERIPSVLS
jgi:hypothetical protein